MKKYILFSITFVIASLLSCSNDNNIDNILDKNNQQADISTVFKPLNIDKVESNVSVNLKMIKGLQNINSTNSNLKRMIGSNTVNASSAFYYSNGSIAYVFSDRNDSIVNNTTFIVDSLGNFISSKDIEFLTEGDFQNFKIKFIDDNNNLVEINSINSNLDIEIIKSNSPQYLFGHRPKGESYSNCFVRTYNEYTKDMIGVVSASACWREVLTAIAIACI